MPKMTKTERAELDKLVAELRENGYKPITEYTYPRSGRKLQVGTRVRHAGEQYWQAIESGTGNVVALLEKPNSAWSRSHGTPDVELVMLRDKQRFGTRLSQVAQYHVEVILR